jgi:hypothetical protein
MATIDQTVLLQLINKQAPQIWVIATERPTEIVFVLHDISAELRAALDGVGFALPSTADTMTISRVCRQAARLADVLDLPPATVAALSTPSNGTRPKIVTIFGTIFALNEILIDRLQAGARTQLERPKPVC